MESFWHNYYDIETIKRGDSIRQVHTVHSTAVDIHVDVYPRAETDAPLVLFNHGAAGYCRLFVELALGLYDRGYTVILPDQRGQGLSGGPRGDYTIAECVQNILDVADWAGSCWGGPLFIAGGSVGGALTYYAAAAARAEAIACLNLFDFGNGLDGVAISRLAPLACRPALCKGILRGTALLKPFRQLRLPFNWFGAFDRLMDERDAAFQALWDADPVPPRRVTVHSLLSSLTTPPAVPFEENTIPVLVINQRLDKMVSPEVTRRNYERLGGPKRYLEVPFGHWSNQPGFWQAIIEAGDEWFRAYCSAWGSAV
jgi:pimeloyl-ACP methyl ester carboxylesterase